MSALSELVGISVIYLVVSIYKDYLFEFPRLVIELIKIKRGD